MRNSATSGAGQAEHAENLDAEEMEFVGSVENPSGAGVYEETIDTRTRLKAISMAFINARPGRCHMLVPPRRIIIARIWGFADGVMDFETDDKPPQILQGLSGEFQAQVYAEDYPTIEAAYYAGICFLPEGAHQELLSKARRIPLDSDGTVSFDLQYAVDPTGLSRNPYKYVWRTLTPRPANDRMAQLERAGNKLANHPDAVQLVRSAPPLIEHDANKQRS